MILALVLCQLATATPTPRPARPAPLLGKSAPVAAGPRSLADAAKEKPKSPGIVSQAESSRVNMLNNARSVCYDMLSKNDPKTPSRDLIDACVQRQKEGFAQVQIPGPADIPKDVFAGIRSACAQTWPGDFSMQLYCEKGKITAYRASKP